MTDPATDSVKPCPRLIAKGYRFRDDVWRELSEDQLTQPLLRALTALPQDADPHGEAAACLRTQLTYLAPLVRAVAQLGERERCLCCQLIRSSLVREHDIHELDEYFFSRTIGRPVGALPFPLEEEFDLRRTQWRLFQESCQLAWSALAVLNHPVALRAAAYGGSDLGSQLLYFASCALEASAPVPSARSELPPVRLVMDSYGSPTRAYWLDDVSAR
jgi:hypothetical protein